MQKHSILLAAALAVTGFALPSFAQEHNTITVAPSNDMASPGNGTSANNADQANTGNNAASANNPNSAEYKQIQTTLATTVDAATSKGNFDTVVGYLSRPDQNRLAASRNNNWSDLDGRIEQFRKDWQEKYGQEFKVGDKESLVFADPAFRILPGQAGDSARTASERLSADRPVNPNTGTQTTGNGTEANSSNINAAQNITGTGNQQRGGDVKSDATKNDAGRVDSNGRIVDPGHGKDTQAARQLGQAAGTGVGGAPQIDIADPNRHATVQIAAEQGADATTLNLINEGTLVPSWRIDIPDSIDGQRLHDSLLKHLTLVDENKANWPSDVAQGYRLVSHHLLAALVDSGSQSQDISPTGQPMGQ